MMKSKIMIISAFVIYFGAIGFICFSNNKTKSVDKAPVDTNTELNNVVLSDKLENFKLGERKKIETNLDLAEIFSSNGNDYALGDPNIFIYINHDKVYFSQSLLWCYEPSYRDSFKNNNRSYKSICEEMKNINKKNHPNASYNDYKDYNYIYGIVADIGGNNYTSIDEHGGGAFGATFIYQDENNAYYYSYNGIFRVDKKDNKTSRFYDGSILDRPLSNKDELLVIKENGYKNTTIEVVDNNTYKSMKKEKFYFTGNEIRLDSTNESDYYTYYEYGIYKNNKLLINDYNGPSEVKYDLFDMFIDDKYVYAFLEKYNYDDGYTSKDEKKDNKIVVFDKNTGEFVKEKEYKKMELDLFDHYLTNLNGSMIVAKYVYNKNNVTIPGTYQILKMNTDTLEFEVLKEMTIKDNVSRTYNFKNRFSYVTHLYESKNENPTMSDYKKDYAMAYTLVLELYDYKNNEFFTIPNVYYYYFNDLENRLYTIEIDDNLNLDLYYYDLTA